MRDHGFAVAFHDELAVMQHRDPLGERERHVHVVLDHHDGGVARDRGDQVANDAAFVVRQPGQRLVQQQQPR